MFLIKASITLGSAVSLLFLISVCIEVTRISTDFSCFWTGTALSKSLRETRSVVFCGFFFFFSSSGLKKKKKSINTRSLIDQSKKGGQESTVIASQKLFPTPLKYQKASNNSQPVPFPCPAAAAHCSCWPEAAVLKS